jgi:hypothetical protein
MNRRALTTVVSILSATILGVALFTLGGSLTPSERTLAHAIKLKVKAPPLGGIVQAQGLRARLILIRIEPDDVLGYSLPTRDGKVSMPDLNWWRDPIYMCDSFGPVLSQPATRLSTFECADSAVPEWWKPRWRWSIQGQPLVDDAGIDPMRRVRVERVGDVLQIYDWDVGA